MGARATQAAQDPRKLKSGRTTPALSVHTSRGACPVPEAGLNQHQNIQTHADMHGVCQQSVRWRKRSTRCILWAAVANTSSVSTPASPSSQQLPTEGYYSPTAVFGVDAVATCTSRSPAGCLGRCPLYKALYVSRTSEQLCPSHSSGPILHNYSSSEVLYKHIRPHYTVLPGDPEWCVLLQHGSGPWQHQLPIRLQCSRLDGLLHASSTLTQHNVSCLLLCAQTPRTAAISAHSGMGGAMCHC